MPEYIPITVVYKKKTGKKVWIKTFTDQRTPDRLILKYGTLLPRGCEILEIGVGKSYESKYKKKYGVR